MFYVALTRARDLLLVSGCGPSIPQEPPPPRKDDLVKLVRGYWVTMPIGDSRDEIIEIGRGRGVPLPGVPADAPRPRPAKKVSRRADAPPPSLVSCPTPSAPVAAPDRLVHAAQRVCEECPRQFRIRRVLASPAAGRRSGHGPSQCAWDRAARGAAAGLAGGSTPTAPHGALARYLELSAEETCGFPRRPGDTANPLSPDESCLGARHT